jgi:lipopolysaccharide export system permease protein
MRISRIDRYIFRELLTPTLISLVVFTFVLLGGRILFLSELILNKGVPPNEVFLLFLDLIPIFLVITLPLSLFLGVLIGYSRLSKENEITAFKASGISLMTLYRPAFFAGLIAVICTGYLTLVAEPKAKIEFRDKIFDIVQERANVGITSQVFNNDIPGITLYVDQVDRSGDLHELFISDERVDGDPAVIFARSGKIYSTPEEHSLTLHLQEGEIHHYGKNKNYQVVAFSTYDIQLHVDKLGGQNNRQLKFGEIPTLELLQLARTTDNPDLRQNCLAQFHKRFVLAISPLLFTLFGLPLTIKRGRSGQGTGFFVALAIFILFHVTQSFAETAVVDNSWPAMTTIWSGPLVLLFCGYFLLWLAAREIPLRLSSFTGPRDKT